VECCDIEARDSWHCQYSHRSPNAGARNALTWVTVSSPAGYCTLGAQRCHWGLLFLLCFLEVLLIGRALPNCNLVQCPPLRLHPNVGVARPHGPRDVPGNAHDHLVAKAELGEFRHQRVAIIDSLDTSGTCTSTISIAALNRTMAASSGPPWLLGDLSPAIARPLACPPRSRSWPTSGWPTIREHPLLSVPLRENGAMSDRRTTTDIMVLVAGAERLS
jgi:hypothetical protein